MSVFRSLLDTAKQSLSRPTTPSSTASPPPKAPPFDKLFPKVNPAVDGDDCDHDCDSCDVKYPKGFSIDEHDQLYGNIKGWSTHVLVATGKTDWVRSVEDEKGSVMEAFGESKVQPSNGVSLYGLPPSKPHTLRSFRLHLHFIGLLFSSILMLTELIAAPYALGFKYSYSVPSQRLCRANDDSALTSFYNY